MIEQTRTKTCQCEDEAYMSRLFPHVKGHLHAGMTLKELQALGSGCTTGSHVCPRLDKLRRRYGR